MRYHKAHLTRRLILDSSADSEKEENMVEWLRVRLFYRLILAVYLYVYSFKYTAFFSPKVYIYIFF